MDRMVVWPGANGAWALAVSGLRARVVADLPGGPLTLFELADVDAALEAAARSGALAPYGGVMWDSAPCVALVVVGLDVAGLRVLELGCGTGLVALAAARAGARVLATDVDELALAATRRAAQHAQLPLETARFDVCSDAALPSADLVVVADLLYEPALALAVARRTLEAIGAGAAVVLGDPGRQGRAALEAWLAERLPSTRPVLFKPVVVGAYRAGVAVLPGG